MRQIRDDVDEQKVAPVGECRPPLGPQIVVVGRERAGTVGIATRPRKSVVGEEGEIAAKTPINPEKKSVVVGVGRGFELVDISLAQIGTHSWTWQRCIDIARAKEMDTAREDVG